jgi:hypothetical protein
MTRTSVVLTLVLSALVIRPLEAQPLPASALLPIAPELQVTPEWCWATVDAMIFHHYGVVDLAHLTNYTIGAHNESAISPVLTAQYVPSPVNRYGVAGEIVANRPIVAGISPTSHNQNTPSEHVALIVGYQSNGAEFRVIVNDPFGPLANVYQAIGGVALRPGQYSIEINRFAQAMTWHESIVGIQPVSAGFP